MIPTWNPPTEADQLQHLFALGYFQGKEWSEVRSFLFGAPVVKQAIEQYVDLHGINGDDMSEHMLRPRCGMPDFARDPQEASQAKWRMLDVTTAHRLTGLNPLAAEREQAAWLEAIQAWNLVCGIRMTQIEDMGRANIYANVGSTGPGVLAYSYLPNNSGPNDQMPQVYNRATNWSYQLLVNVAIHEIGHAIGLDHGPRGSIMQPTASGDVTRPQEWDIEQVVSRYGQPGPTTPPTPPTGQSSLELKFGLGTGQYQLEPNETDYDLIVPSDIKAGRYRTIGEFQTG